MLLRRKLNNKPAQKFQLIDRKNDLDSLSQIEEAKEKYDLINQAISAYFMKYTLPGRQLTRPGINSSTVEGERVFLRTGKFLLAIFQINSGRFLRLSPELLKKYSK